MANAHRHPLPQSLKNRASRALPYYFYVLGVVAALGFAALLIAAEVQGKTPAALDISDLMVVPV